MSSDVIIKNHEGQDITYPGVSGIVLRTANGSALYLNVNDQPDWAQTDKTAMNYIKNKPFYDNSLTSQCSFETLPEIKFNALGYTFWQIADFTLEYSQIFSTVFDITQGSHSYSLTPTESEIILNDEKILAFQSAELGYGFVICYTAGAFDITVNEITVAVEVPATGIYFIYSQDYIPSAEYFFKITYNDLKTLDKKFLPADLEFSQKQADWDQIDESEKDFIKNKPFGKENNVILDGTFQDTKYDSDGDGIGDTWNGEAMIEDSSDSTLVVGETYTVVWNSVEYRCECIEAMGLIALGNTIVIGGEDNGIPFAVARDVSGAVVGTPCWIAIPVKLEDSGTYHCTISGDSIKKIDLQYLYQPDWNENNRNSGSYIANKPFGEITAGTIIVPKQNVNLTIDFADNGELWASMVPNMGLGGYVIEGKNYNINFDGSYYMGVGVVQDGMGIGVVYQSDSTSILIIDDYEGKGVSLIVSNQSGQHTVSVICIEDIVTKIDSKYLPDSLPTVTTDDVGKFLRVGADGTWVAETILNAEEASF